MELLKYLLIYALLGVSFGHASETSSPEKGLLSASPEEEKILKEIAYQVFDAIKNKPPKELLQFFDTRKRVAWGGDGSLSYREIKEQLIKKKGTFYCYVFGCKDSELTSVKTVFSKIDPKKLQFKIREKFDFETKDEIFVDVIFLWPEKPASGDFNEPTFVYDKHNKKWHLERAFI